jgi:hypothetical protein
MDRTRDQYMKRDKPDWERQIAHVISHIWNLVLKD